MRTGEVATYQMTTPGEHVLHFDNLRHDDEATYDD